MIYLKRGEDKTIPLTAKNDSGGIINLSSATITATVKANRDSSTILVSKSSSSSSEIEVVTAASGIFLLKFLENDFLTLENRDYYLDVKVTTSGGLNYRTHNEVIKLEKTVKGSGGTLIPVSLDQGKQIWFKNVDGTLTTMAASRWTANPTAAWAGSVLTITSSGSEFTSTMIKDSSLTNQFTVDSDSTSSIQMTFNTVSGTFFIWVTEVTT